MCHFIHCRMTRMEFRLIYFLVTLCFVLTSISHITSTILNNDVEDNFNVVCYYALEKEGNIIELQPEFIDPFICTHIIIGFAAVNNNTLQPANPEDIQKYEKVIALKQKNPKLKIILAAGGGGSQATFSDMVQTNQTRASFIKQSVKFLNDNGFDGFDLDWEFPAWEGHLPNEKQLFAQFLTEFRSFVGPDYILSVDVAVMQPILWLAYDVKQMAEAVTFINMMCYDYHSYKWYFRFTGHNSPLYKRSIESGYFATLNTEWTTNYWLENGMPATKINMGIPTYGNTLKLLNPKWNTFDAPCTGIGLFGGTITRPMVCLFLKNGGTEIFDDESQVPYASHDLDWISYETEKSITVKVVFARSKKLAGVMTFDLNCDDWAGSCDRKTTFPLHRAINKAALSVPAD